MKKQAGFTLLLLLSICSLTGCGKEEVAQAIEPFILSAQGDDEILVAQADDEKEEEIQLMTIDSSIPITAGMHIAVVSKSVKGEFWDRIKEGMEAAVSEINDTYGFSKDEAVTMTFEGPSDETKVDDQINTIDAVIAENPDVLCLSVADMESCQAQLEAASENGIPVIIFDSNVSDDSLVTAYRATNNVRIGKLAAKELVSAIGKIGDIVIFAPQECTQTTVDRVEGFSDYVEACADANIVETVYGDQVDDLSTAITETIEKYPALDGVFCANADVAETYLAAEKHLADGQTLAMVGVDGTSKQIEAVRDGEEIGLVSQEPYSIGYQTILAAAYSTADPGAASVEIPKSILFEPAWIDMSNIDDADYARFIYKK